MIVGHSLNLNDCTNAKHPPITTVDIRVEGTCQTITLTFSQGTRIQDLVLACLHLTQAHHFRRLEAPTADSNCTRPTSPRPPMSSPETSTLETQMNPVPGGPGFI